jgi:hypothetical protein
MKTCFFNVECPGQICWVHFFFLQTITHLTNILLQPWKLHVLMLFATLVCLNVSTVYLFATPLFQNLRCSSLLWNDMYLDTF